LYWAASRGTGDGAPLCDGQAHRCVFKPTATQNLYSVPPGRESGAEAIVFA
jgi:hypothetical protein